MGGGGTVILGLFLVHVFVNPFSLEVGGGHVPPSRPPPLDPRLDTAIYTNPG